MEKRRVKYLVVYTSIHHKNTEKIAKEIAEELVADLKRARDIKPSSFKRYELIGFGSGIYFGKHHKNILELIKKADALANKHVFIFSTRGMPLVGKFYHKELRKILKNKKAEIVGEFSCRGHDTYYDFLKKIGGIAKGHPDKKDLERASSFAKKTKGKLED